MPRRGAVGARRRPGGGGTRRGGRREAEEEERVAARELEANVREAAWATAQAERLRQEHERAVAALAVLEEAGAAGCRPRPPDRR